jgi:phosphatidylinositol alpha-1,6-mannosyltransferase
MNTIYCASDGFMLECREVKANRQPESSGMVYLATGACSAPVIGASSGWIEGALVEGETGVLLNRHDTEEIARATIRLLTDGELALPPWSQRPTESPNASSIGRT